MLLICVQTYCRGRARTSHTKMHGEAATVQQFMIIRSDPPPTTNKLGPLEYDLGEDDFLPDVRDISWPRLSQQKHLSEEKQRRLTSRIICGENVLTDASNTGRIVIPDKDEDMQALLILIAHQNNHAHRSIADTMAQLKSTFTWSNMEADVRRKVKSCIQCMKQQGGHIIPRPMWNMVRATKPFEYIHLDCCHLPPASSGHKYILVVVDDLSGTVLLHPTIANRCGTWTRRTLARTLS